jgi:hypothetical protein
MFSENPNSGLNEQQNKEKLLILFRIRSIGAASQI